MKKTLLAAALVTGFAGVAHAESSVTLYGLVDAGYGYSNVETKLRGAYPNEKVSVRNIGARNGVMNGNRWGLKGSEDLGNGTSAIFVLESGFDLGNGRQLQRDGDRDRLFGRQAYVGLTGESWGTFTIGRQYNAADTFVAPIDPFGTGGDLAAVGTIFGGSPSARFDNVLKYVSPNFSGFQFGLGVVHDDTRTKETDLTGTIKSSERTIGVTTGLGYTNGPIYLGASFDYLNQKDKVGGVTTDSKTKAWNVGGTYDFEVVKLHLLYGGQSGGSIDGVGALADASLSAAINMPGTFDQKGLRQHSWLAGLSAPVADAGTVMFSYAGNTVKNKNSLNGNPDIKAKSHNFGLGYRHGLSKRTSVYGVASYGWSEAKERNFSVDGTGKAKTTATSAIVGLQHRF